MSKTHQKCALCRISLCVSLVAVLLSLAAVFVEFPPNKEPNVDYTGIIVSVLSILIMLLVGWQIFTSIKFENNITKTVDDLRDEMNGHNDVINRKSQIAKKCAIASSLFELYNMNNWENSGKVSEYYIFVLFKCLYYCDKDVCSEPEGDAVYRLALSQLIYLFENKENKDKVIYFNRDAYTLITMTVERIKEPMLVQFVTERVKCKVPSPDSDSKDAKTNDQGNSSYDSKRPRRKKRR